MSANGARGALLFTFNAFEFSDETTQSAIAIAANLSIDNVATTWPVPQTVPTAKDPTPCIKNAAPIVVEWFTNDVHLPCTHAAACIMLHPTAAQCHSNATVVHSNIMMVVFAHSMNPGKIVHYSNGSVRK